MISSLPACYRNEDYNEDSIDCLIFDIEDSIDCLIFDIEDLIDCLIFDIEDLIGDNGRDFMELTDSIFYN